MQWVETPRYLDVTLDTQLTFSVYVNQVEDLACLALRRAGEAVCPSETVRCCMNSFILWCITHILSGCPLFAATPGGCRYYKCLRIATNAPWYGGYRQIHEDLGITFFAVRIRAPTGSSDSGLADTGNPLDRQLLRHLCRPRADWRVTGNRGELILSRPAEAVPQRTASSAQRLV
jgi:hypothetical protein